ncbi:hypothetical protein BT69DRAFT_1290621 [Atractiella rhizophila]|nr:hypothetical protein BT69DRAFT_1290621 [Atractiella rhizophila]
MVQALHVLFLHLAGSDRSYRVFGDGKVLLNLIYPHFQLGHAHQATIFVQLSHSTP